MSVIVVVPDCPVAGVTVTVRLSLLPPNTILALGIRSGFEEAPVRRSEAAAVSASPIVKLIGPRTVSCRIVWPLMAEIVGGVLTVLTVRVNVVALVNWPSLTRMVMMADPVSPAAGVIVTVRFVPVPLKTMLLFGTRAMFEALPSTPRLSGLA